MRKPSHLVRSILSILLIATGVVVYLRWDAWFGEPTEPSYTLPDSPCRLLLTPGANPSASRSIRWVSGTADRMSVTLDRDSLPYRAYLSSVDTVHTQGGTTFVHHVETDSLPPGSYTYTVCGREGDTPSQTFEIRSSDRLRLIFIGDIQERTEGDTRRVVQEIDSRHSDADAWLFVGDMIERPHDAYWTLWYNAFADVAPRKPLIATPGNHEHHKGLTPILGERWAKTFGYPSNGFDPSSDGENYYIDYPLCRIITLNSTRLSARTILAARSWLRTALEGRPDAFRIVMWHHPKSSLSIARLNPLTRWGLAPITESKQAPAHLVLQGHDHGYARTASSDHTAPVYIISSFSPKHYRPSSVRGYEVSDFGERWYQVIDILGDMLMYRSFTDKHQLIDHFVVTLDGKVSEPTSL